MSFHAQSTFNSCQLRHIEKTAPLCVYVYVCVYAYIVTVELLVRGHLFHSMRGRLLPRDMNCCFS